MKKGRRRGGRQLARERDGLLRQRGEMEAKECVATSDPLLPQLGGWASCVMSSACCRARTRPSSCHSAACNMGKCAPRRDERNQPTETGEEGEAAAAEEKDGGEPWLLMLVEADGLAAAGTLMPAAHIAQLLRSSL